MGIVKSCFCWIAAIAVYALPVTGQVPDQVRHGRVLLPNGWSLTPIGRSLPLGDLPLNIAVSRSKKWIAVTNNGQSAQSIQLFDASTEKLADRVSIPKSWLGLKFSMDEQYLYASGGNDNCIIRYRILHHKLIISDSFMLGKKWPEKISPAGLEIDDARKLLYVVTKENNQLYIVDLPTKKILGRYPLGAEGYTCVLSPDSKELYISCWGAGKVLVFDAIHRTFTSELLVGDHPNDLCLSQSGAFLFVANASDNSVSVIDIRKRKVLETLNAALFPEAAVGSTSNALALSTDNKTLYVANADNNCLAVFDVSLPGDSHAKGFIPVGWYPTAVKVIGRKVFVANGKGFSSMANPFGPSPVNKKQEVAYQKSAIKTRPAVQYIGGLFKGTLSIFSEPTAAELSTYSALVYENTPYTKAKELQASGEAGNPVPMRVGDSSAIKYVFYIIKENRTYDQVLGDVATGNGDTSLVLFGNKVTPNQHALADQFVLLDNFYCDAEVSADGHNWSMGAYANDYLEKTWPTSYGGRGGEYDGEGNRMIANNNNGFIWDYCKRAGVSFRTYGEFADNFKPNIAVLQGHHCPGFTGFDLGVRDTVRVGQWKKDFDSLLAVGLLPRLNTIRLGNDHTEGVSKGRPTPFADVADNDLAVGELIAYLSTSPIWKEAVVFILEDDAQNGADHVDAHRSPAYVAGGLVKRHFVDHTMYSTTSMVRTIELILGIGPMSQFDAAATPMWRCFGHRADLRPFISLPANISLDDKNVASNDLEKKSAAFDFSREDRVPETIFNEILWKSIKGMDVLMPPARRAAFVKSDNKKYSDD